MVPANEKFERKLVSILDYQMNKRKACNLDPDDQAANEGSEEDTELVVNQELIETVVYGQERILGRKISAAKREISNLTTKQRELQ